MSILKGNEGLAHKVGKAESHRTIQWKLLAELDVFMVDAVDLIGNVRVGLLINNHTVRYILIVTSHQISPDLVQFLHLSQVETQRHWSNDRTFFDRWFLLHELIEACIQLIRQAFSLLDSLDPFFCLLLENLLQLLFIQTWIDASFRVIRKEEGNILYKNTEISLRCVGKIGDGVNLVLLLAIVEEKDDRANDSGQIEDIQHI